MLNGVCPKCQSPLLERFNGEIFCMKCAEIQRKNKLSVTEHSDSLFRLSELCYFNYLVPKNKNDEGLSELLSDAISICSEAASLNHPKALFRMGFYYEYYMKNELSESERIRRAFDLYARVVDIDNRTEFHALTDGRYSSEHIKDADEFRLLKDQAAFRAISLLEKHPHVFGLNRIRGKINRRVALANKICARLGIDNKFLRQSGSIRTSRAAEIYGILSDCYDKKRPPLFGTFLISGAELHELLAFRKDEERGIKHDADVICEQLCFRYLAVDENGMPTLKEQTDFYGIRQGAFPVNDREMATEQRKFVADDSLVIFTFFNRVHRGGFLSKKSVERTYSQLFPQSEASVLMRLVSGSSGKDHIFYPDDVVWLERVEHKPEISHLIELVCMEG